MLGILCAGGLASKRLREAGVERVPLLYCGDETILERSCRVLLEAGCTEVAVLAPEEVPLPALPGVVRAAHSGELIPSLIACAKSFGGEDAALLSSADLPLISVEGCRAVARAGEESGADLVYPVFSRADTEARFGKAKRTYAKLGGVEYTGGNVFYARLSWLTRQEELLTKLFAMRKSPPGLARIFGLSFLLGLLTGRLTLAGLEERLGKIVGGKLNAAPLPYVELGMDVDKPEDLEALRDFVSPPPAMGV
jgi:molybdopterin-guanine dinucleotide biosynthesis protein A